MKTLYFTEKELSNAWQEKKVAGISGIGLCVRFVMVGGVEDGYLVDEEQAIIRFNEVSEAWDKVKQIKKPEGI